MIKPKIEEKIVKTINTQERIGIAQCINLANEYLIARKEHEQTTVLFEQRLKEVTKMFYEIKSGLEKEFEENDGKFRS